MRTIFGVQSFILKGKNTIGYSVFMLDVGVQSFILKGKNTNSVISIDSHVGVQSFILRGKTPIGDVILARFWGVGLYFGG